MNKNKYSLEQERIHKRRLDKSLRALKLGRRRKKEAKREKHRLKVRDRRQGVILSRILRYEQEILNGYAN